MTMCAYFGTIRLIIILWTSICLQDAQAIRKPFKVVERCPFNESEWKVRAVHVTCNGSESYHCLLTEGGVSMREQCTEASLFTSGYCPIFTNEGYIQWSPCKDTACPASAYRSDQVYQYQICYRKPDNPKRSNDSSSEKEVTMIIVAILLVFLLVLISVLLVFYKRNQFGLKDKVQQCISDIQTHFQHSIDAEDLQDVEIGEPPEQAQPLIQGIHDETRQKTYKMTALLKYIVHILKQELCVNDLKEKVVIHSKSINEHFDDILIKDLQSVKDINDYDQLNISLVFALLHNFCKRIKPPNRGWDYEPLDDETHIGADIERIKLMWNKYCDDDLQFKHLDDVFNRMKQNFGTVAVHGDYGVRKSPLKDEEHEEGFERMKEKIHSVKLNPVCKVEKGIVITENITTALKILKSRNVVILKGVIGCGKTHALKAIQNYFQEKNWETVWVEPENFGREISYKKPKVLLCDNLFGKFGSSVFSQDAVIETEYALKEIESSIQETKVVIGIHTHVYDEVKKNFKLNFLHQRNIKVEMDNLSEAETLLIFKEQLKKGHCKRDPNCWFKCVGFQSVLDKLSKNQGHIGDPFLSLMYCNQHEMFTDNAFSVNPVRTLVKHIEKMRNDSPIPYDCLVYLMCVQRHNCEEEPNMPLAQQISANITKHNLMHLVKTSYLVQVDTKIATLAHELLTVVLFKSTVDKKEMFSPVLQLCDIDVFLQLLRPKDTCSTHSDIYFEYMYDRNMYSRDIWKMCAYRLANIYKTKENNHPLLRVELVKDKYLHYLLKEPNWLRQSDGITE